jgi:hypothetical protein
MPGSGNPFVRHDGTDTRALKTTTHHDQITDIEKATTGTSDNYALVRWEALARYISDGAHID